MTCRHAQIIDPKRMGKVLRRHRLLRNEYLVRMCDAAINEKGARARREPQPVDANPVLPQKNDELLFLRSDDKPRDDGRRPLPEDCFVELVLRDFVAFADETERREIPVREFHQRRAFHARREGRRNRGWGR